MNFILFGLKRSGTTSLMSALNEHPKIRCAREPFNPQNYGGRYLHKALKMGSPEVVLPALWESYHGIKHVCDTDGWPFDGRPELNEDLLTGSGRRVVLLRRRNLLQRIVSAHISLQAGVWTPFTQLHRAWVRNFQYHPLDLEAVRRQVVNDREALERWRRLLEVRGVEHLILDYEDLYDPTVTTAKRRHRFEALLTWLGYGPVTDRVALERIDRLLDPAWTRLNSMQTYARIPGIAEIERTLAGPDTGSLFNESLAQPAVAGSYKGAQ